MAMPPHLEAESERLVRSWMRHDAEMLRGYLVADVEDPRLNLQSLLTRHFLLRALTGEEFAPLMFEECRFALAMNWILRLTRSGGTEDGAAALYALEHGADNAEGIEIPRFLSRTFATLPTRACGLAIPNYLRATLADTDRQCGLDHARLDFFLDLWRMALFPTGDRSAAPRLSVLEPACGSANDYRALAACGLAARLDYTGFDLCPRNIENAKAFFPAGRFQAGNVFAIPATAAAFDLGFAHDLFEHLSPAGLAQAIAEVCRVTRRGLCVGFFNMDEIPEHAVQPVEEYHWNRLSMTRTRELFARQGFAAQVIHIGTFAREQFGCDQTHNPNAYTFFLERNSR